MFRLRKSTSSLDTPLAHVRQWRSRFLSQRSVGVPEVGAGACCGKSVENELGSNTPSRRCRTPPSTFAKATVDEGEEKRLLVRQFSEQ